MVTITQTAPTALQLSAQDEEGKPILSVLCKRTYDVLPGGRVVPAAEQLPLVLDFEPDPENPRRLARDFDLYPVKLKTDIVVRGHVYGSGRRALIATVQVASCRKEIAVIGNRRCTLGASGRVIVSAPDPIERIPLRYDRAYGGIDQVAHDTHGNPFECLGKYLDASVDISLSSPYLYPRNHAGVGYLIESTRAAVERLVLPNLEDPLDLLSPDRLAVGAPGLWPLMPIPQSFDWLDPGTFPRFAHMGVVHDHQPLASTIAEVSRGYVPNDILESKPIEKRISLLFANGASLGLQVPHLQGGELCMLGGIHPTLPVWKFRLPSERPIIQTDGRNGRMNDTRPVIHTVDIEPDEQRFAIVWRGSAPALRPYMPDEIKTMPLLVRWQ